MRLIALRGDFKAAHWMTFGSLMPCLANNVPARHRKSSFLNFSQGTDGEPLIAKLHNIVRRRFANQWLNLLQGLARDGSQINT